MMQRSIFDVVGYGERPASMWDHVPADDLERDPAAGIQYVPALTIHQPWANLITEGRKFVENRVWASTYRGPLLIHAGKGSTTLTAAQLRRFTTGAIVGVADLAGIIHLARVQALAEEGTGSPQFSADQVQAILGHQYTEGPFCWILRHARPLERPIPCKGFQKFWKPPAEVWDQVVAQRPDLGLDHVWHWRKRLPERKGQRCRVVSRGAKNSVLVQFQDGVEVITSRHAVRKISK